MIPPPRAPSLSIENVDIAHNLRVVRRAINDAAVHAGRNPLDVRLIAVSKTVPRGTVEAAVRAGQTDFGENTVQEALSKFPSLHDLGLTGHFIGYLQTNKAKFIPGHFSWVHSIDRLPLAQKLSRACEGTDARLDTLVQVNVTRDPNKRGVAPESTFELIEQLMAANLTHISLRGLMTLGPYHGDERILHDCFARLRALREECAQRFALPEFTELSMGMTDDFPIAIAEGATMVRIGTAIFGERAYKTLRD